MSASIVALTLQVTALRVPCSTDTGTGLQEVFLAHVRLGHVLEQQHVAMKISKASPGELQTFWVVCSMLAQVVCARAGMAVSPMQPDMLLKLAGALAAKQLQAEGILSYEGVLVYMDVLQAQDNLEGCTELLEGPCAAAVQMPHELARLKVRLPADATQALLVLATAGPHTSARHDSVLPALSWQREHGRSACCHHGHATRLCVRVLLDAFVTVAGCLSMPERLSWCMTHTSAHTQPREPGVRITWRHQVKLG